MRKMKIQKGATVNFQYLTFGDDGLPEIAHRGGVVESLKRTTGRTSRKAYRGKKLILFTIVEDGQFKSFHFNRMSNIAVTA